jgi:hypothetical protein
MLLATTGCTSEPSDAYLEQFLVNHEHAFNELVRMFEMDERVKYISEGKIDPEDGLSAERLEEYKALLEQLGVQSIHRYQVSEGQVTLRLKGSLWDVVEKGYLFSPTPVSPLYETLDELPKGRDPRERAYKRVLPNWFIYARRSS